MISTSRTDMAKNLCERRLDLNAFAFGRMGCFRLPQPVIGELKWKRGEAVNGVGFRVSTRERRMTLTYAPTTPSGTKERVGCDIGLDATSCHFGGWRWWFLCPAVCYRRVAILYFDGERFACRKCHGLAYASQNVPHGTGKMAATMRLLDACYPRKDPEAIRYKFWRGRPTKRYAKATARHMGRARKSLK